MKDRKWSDSSDVRNMKDNQFLNNCSNTNGTQLWQISQTLKFATTRFKTTKTIITKNKIVYSNVTTQSMMKEVIQKGTEELKKKEEQLLVQLMQHIIGNIKLKIQNTLLNNEQLYKNKELFKSIVHTLEDQFKSVNEELSRIRHYTKRKEIKNVLNLQINCLNGNKFVNFIFANFPKLQVTMIVFKDFFMKFEIQTLSNSQIEQLKRQIELIDEFVDFDSLREKRAKQKKISKKNRKKRNRNKNKIENENSTNQGEELKEREEEGIDNNSDYKLAQFLQSLSIGGNRSCCHVSDDWLNSLKLKYIQ